MDRVDELTRKDLIKGLDKRTKKYSKKLTTPIYKGITSDYTVVFLVPSSDRTTQYTVLINLVEFKDFDNDTTLSTEDKVRLCIDGDVKLNCTCPAMRYWGYEYILSQLDSIDGTEQTIYPSVRNPELEGTLCKHAYVAVRYLGKLWKKIAKDIDTMNFIEK